MTILWILFGIIYLAIGVAVGEGCIPGEASWFSALLWPIILFVWFYQVSYEKIGDWVYYNILHRD